MRLLAQLLPVSEPVGATYLDLPVHCGRWNSFEVAVKAENRGRGSLSPAGQAWIAIGAIAHEGEVVGDRFGVDAELRPHPVGVDDRAALAAVELHDLAAHDLAEVLVRRADVDTTDFGEHA